MIDNTTTVLRIVVDPCEGARITADGAPVWCVADAAEAAALRVHADRLGVASELLDAQATRIDDRGPWRDGCVASLALADVRIGEAYARLTGRRHVEVANEAALARIDDLEVVLLVTGSLTASLLHALYGPANCLARAPGLVMAGDEVRLARTSRRLALGAHALPPTSVGSAVIDEFLADARALSANERVCGAGSTPAQVQGVLGEGAGFLSLEGHSDGIHLSLPSEAMLCPVSRDQSTRDNQPTYCAQARCCPRYAERPSLEQAWERHALVAPRSVAARVVYNGGCFALRVADGVLDVRHSLACALSEQASVLAVIGAWQSTLGDPRVADKLHQLLASGVDVGAAVRTFNALDTRQRSGRRLAILGDPLCVATSLDPARGDRSPAVLPSQMLEEDEASPLRGFLRHCIDYGLRTNFFSDEAAALAVENGLDAAAQASIAGHAPDTRFREMLLRYFASFGRIGNVWGEAGSALAVDENTPCPGCGSLSVRMRIMLAPRLVRHSTVCPRCDEVENFGSQPIPRVDFSRIAEGLIRLPERPPSTSALVNVVGRYLPESQSWAWPVDASGELRETFELPRSAVLPAGPLACRVFFAEGLNVSMAAVKLRMPSPGTTAFAASATRGSLPSPNEAGEDSDRVEHRPGRR